MIYAPSNHFCNIKTEINGHDPDMTANVTHFEDAMVVILEHDELENDPT